MIRTTRLATAAGVALAGMLTASGAMAEPDASPAAAGATAAAAEFRAAPAGATSANPLWGIAIKQLSSTRDHPLFSPSRRPPPPVAPAPVAIAPPPVEKPKEPDRPQLALLGTIVNGEDGYGLFMDQVKTVPVRVRIGVSYQGWTLSKIRSSAVTLERNGETVELAFPKPAGEVARKKDGVAGILAATGAALRSALPHSAAQPPVPPSAQSPPPEPPPLRRAITPANNPFAQHGPAEHP